MFQVEQEKKFQEKESKLKNQYDAIIQSLKEKQKFILDEKTRLLENQSMEIQDLKREFKKLKKKNAEMSQIADGLQKGTVPTQESHESFVIQHQL